jgi:DNA-binding transcriptional LysR family regulator
VLDISKMRQVIAIHETGSLARAADRLGLAQASLSKSLARLEDELGVRIFERSSTGSRPTLAGTLIVERAKHLIDATEHLQRDVSLLAGGATKELAIGAAIALASQFLPGLAQRVADKFPEMRMRLEVASAQRLLDRLSSRNLDIVFAGLPPQAHEGGFDVVPLFTAPVVVVARPDHALAGARNVTPEDLREHRFSGLFPHIARGLGHGEDVEWMGFYQSEQFKTLAGLAEAGHTILLAPEFVVRSRLQAGTLVRLDCDWTHEIAYSAVTNKGVTATKVIGGVIAVARECAANL